MAVIYLSLGSNLGDKHRFLDDALKGLRKRIGIQKISSVYRTEPWGRNDQPDFLNLCVSGETSLSPAEVLSFAKSIEGSLGRTPGERWGPREIDIDLLLYGDEIISLPGLEVPHPHLEERAFVLVPLAEIAPDFKHPKLSETIAELAGEIDSTGVEKVSNE